MARSPLLLHIIRGSPSVSLNLLRLTQRAEPGSQPFFASPAMNQVIIFKYPNFEFEIAEEEELEYGRSTAWISVTRPVETAIFIPQNPEMPENGGYAIYVRQRNFTKLFRLHLGVDLVGDDSPDVKILQVMDQVPSLDPFLLKTTFDQHNISVPSHFFHMAEAEEQLLKTKVAQRILPVIGLAVGVSQTDLNRYAERFVQAIWNPHLKEASLFIEALRISPSQATEIFHAWKGITFYQLQFERELPKITQVLDWFRSAECVPIDIHAHAAFRDQLEMYKIDVVARIQACIAKIRQIFRDYEGAYDALIKRDDPSRFREFLITSGSRYWVLGYCSISLSHCASVFNRAMRRSLSGRMMYGEMNQMLTNMSVLLSSQTRPGSLMA